MTREKVTTSEEVDKGTKNQDDTKEAVVTIRRKDLDNFEGQSKGSTEFLERKFSTLEPDLYRKLYEKDIEGQYMEPYKTFVLPFDTTKLNLFMRNDSVTIKKEKHSK